MRERASEGKCTLVQEYGDEGVTDGVRESQSASMRVRVSEGARATVRPSETLLKSTSQEGKDCHNDANSYASSERHHVTHSQRSRSYRPRITTANSTQSRGRLVVNVHNSFLSKPQYQPRRRHRTIQVHSFVGAYCTLCEAQPLGALGPSTGR